jgi:hypothetical protein
MEEQICLSGKMVWQAFAVFNQWSWKLCSNWFSCVMIDNGQKLFRSGTFIVQILVILEWTLARLLQAT